MKRFISTLALLLLVPFTAKAHAFLDDAVPKVGSVVAIPLKEIRITYTQSIEPAFSHIALVDSNGQAIATGPVALDPANAQVLIAPVTGQMVPGHYEVRWDVLSVDTHHTDGHYPFDFQP